MDAVPHMSDFAACELLSQDYKGKRLVAVDSPEDDMGADGAEADESNAKEANEQKPKLVGKQQDELADFFKVNSLS